MKYLLKYMKDYKTESILAPLFKLFEALLELFVPIVMAYIIDNGISNSDIGYVIKMCGVLIALGVAGLGFSITAQFFAAKASVGFAKNIKHALFSQFQKFSYSDIDSVGTSAMITRLTSDANQIQNGVNLTLRLLLRSPFIVFGAMIMAFTVDKKAALIFAAVIPVLFLAVFAIILITIPLYKKVQKRLETVLLKTRENLTGVRVIRAFGREDEEKEVFKNKNQELANVQNFAAKFSTLTNPLTYVIINIAIVILIKTGALRVWQGYITQGAVVALYNYMSQILVELIKFANLVISITKSLASANRVSEILKIKPSMEGGKSDIKAEDGEYSVEFENVWFCYGDNKEYSVIDASFKILRGETVGIIGATGSGKSSIVNMIPRFYDCDKGVIKVDGIDVRDYPISELREKIGVVLQNPVIFSGTIRENMLWGNENASDEEIINALKTAQIIEILDIKEGGLDFHIEQGGKNLSGGQRRRLTIARALVKNPEILILDDASAGLDFATAAGLRKALKQLHSTVFIVSQRISDVKNSDKIIVLDDGKICGIGDHNYLIENCTVYRDILNSQVKNI